MRRRVAILGAGPVGLDAALAFTDAGWRPKVYKAGPSAATNVRAWEHVPVVQVDTAIELYNLGWSLARSANTWASIRPPS
ncbi:MAG: hypothetical protein ACRDQ1_16335 [Sciscionella sp.]